jgi:hypothetical protein
MVFDRGAEEVVCSDSGKRATDLAKRCVFGPPDDFRKRGDADSGIETHPKAG